MKFHAFNLSPQNISCKIKTSANLAIKDLIEAKDKRSQAYIFSDIYIHSEKYKSTNRPYSRH